MSEQFIPIELTELSEKSLAILNNQFQKLYRVLRNISTGAGIPGSRIEDEAITTDKIAADAVTANKINVPGLDDNGDIIIEDGAITTPKLAAGAVTADKMTITDLIDVANKMTLASGRVVIDKDAFGTDLEGIKINDGTYDRVEIGEISSGNYGINIRDNSGNLWISSGNPQSLFKKVYDNELSSATTSLSISGLDGDNDLVYFLSVKIWNTIAGGTPNPEVDLRINSDSGSNYGWRHIQSSGDPASVTTSFHTSETHIPLTYYTASNRIGFASTWIFAKSGKIRTIISNQMYDTAGTTVRAYRCLGGIWNNTSSNITSINLVANKTNGIGAGSHIILYKVGD